MSLLLSQIGGGGGTVIPISLSDTVTVSDSLVKSIGLNQSDSIVLSDSLAKALGLSKSDSVSVTDAIAKTIGIVTGKQFGRAHV